MGVKARGGTEKEEEEEEKEKEEEKFLLCESIGHRPLRGRCPKRKQFPNQGEEAAESKSLTLFPSPD